jgi:hypothetical protein
MNFEDLINFLEDPLFEDLGFPRLIGRVIGGRMVSWPCTRCRNIQLPRGSASRVPVITSGTIGVPVSIASLNAPRLNVPRVSV